MKGKNSFEQVWAIILAAGKGKRMQVEGKNKVTYKVAGVPMIVRSLRILRKTGIRNYVVVVGFAKESVLKLLKKDIHIAYQRFGLGTGNAVAVAMKEIPENAEDVLVLNGDDSFFYSDKILRELYEMHNENNSKVSFVTVEVDDPIGLGRIIRDKNDDVSGIMEEKDATPKNRKIKEINPACYIFDANFLRKNLKKIPKSEVTGEYYLTSLVHIAVEEKAKIETLRLRNFHWRGVNTPQELEEAERIVKEVEKN